MTDSIMMIDPKTGMVYSILLDPLTVATAHKLNLVPVSIVDMDKLAEFEANSTPVPTMPPIKTIDTNVLTTPDL